MKNNEFRISIIQLVLVYIIGLFVGVILIFIPMNKIVMKQSKIYNYNMTECRKLNTLRNHMIVMDEVERYINERTHNSDDLLVQLMKFRTIVALKYKLKVDKLIKEVIILKGLRDANKTR